ncbi:MAG: type II secretion system protein [Campylobacterota bacterium]|nr:type II secretion system protein [Campylobacterota bacterium]
MIIQKQRKAFSMITALFVIVLMSTVAAYIMSMSGKIAKQTTAQYQKEQAMLLAKSYTEYAILAVMSNDRNATGGQCLGTITGAYSEGGGYTIETQISYIGDAKVATCTNVLSSSVTTLKSPLNIIVDVYVKYKDLDHPDIANAPDLTYHRRTLQKI